MKLWFLTTFFFWIFLCIDWSHSYDRSAIRPKWLTFTNPWRNVLTESTFLWKRLLPRMVTNHVTYKPLIQILHEAFKKICTKCCIQGRNKVFFFLTDPVFCPKFWSLITKTLRILIPDHKNIGNFDPWSQKRSQFWSLIPQKHCWSRSQVLWSQILGLWSLISYTLLRPCNIKTKKSRNWII